MLSIIIPTKNEESYLPRLLESIERQCFSDYEVIVADADSSDDTRKIARSFGARVVKGGLPGVGRNAGARVARGDVFLFLDADVVLPSCFLERNLREFCNKNIDCAATFVRPLSADLFDKLIHKVWNVSYKVLAKCRPGACGFHIFVKRSFFEKINGFDESIWVGEDFDFIFRVWKAGARYGLLRVPVFVSVRRLEKEGRLGFLAKNLTGFAYMALRGPMRKSIFRYDFGHESVPKSELKFLRKR